MLNFLRPLLTPKLLTLPLLHFARTKKPQSIQQSPQHHTSLRSRSLILRQLLSSCRDDNKQKADLILDDEFYSCLNNSEGNESYMHQLLKWKISVDFVFRDYPGVLMSLDNVGLLARNCVDAELMQIQRLLILVLYDHQLLAKTLKKSQKTSYKTFFSLYIKSVCSLIVNQPSETSTKQLFQILNTPLPKLLNNNQPGIQLLDPVLLDTQDKSILNIKEQIFFNLLIYSMYVHANAQTTINKNTALNLYKKIKARQKIQLSDTLLENYEQFLNIWISAKYDAPMQWEDLQPLAKVPYYKYLYIIAENYYLNQQITDANRILNQLPKSYPLRQMLQLSQLYDKKCYKEAQQKFNKILQKREQNSCRYSVQQDIVIMNIMKIMQKCEQKKLNTNPNKKVSSQQNIELELKRANTILLKYDLNMKDLQSKGIPYYYLIIPFQDYLLGKEFGYFRGRSHHE